MGQTDKQNLTEERDNLLTDKQNLTQERTANRTEIASIQTDKQNLTEERNNLLTDKQNLETEIASLRNAIQLLDVEHLRPMAETLAAEEASRSKLKRLRDAAADRAKDALETPAKKSHASFEL